MRRWALWVKGGLFFCIGVLALSVHTAGAGNLSIETQTTRQIKGDQLSIRVVVTNKGSAPAYDLQAHLNAVGTHEASSIIPQLDPGQSDTVTFKRDIQDLIKGRYPMIISVDFHDANQYPFTALSGMTFYKEVDVNPQLITEAENLTIDGEGTLRVRIKNLSEAPRRIESTLYIPKEFSTAKPKEAFTIAGRSEKMLTFPLSNFSALPNASYPVFCMVEYDADHAHHTAVVRAVVSIAEDEGIFRRFRWLWIALVGVLAVCLIGVVVKERKKRGA